MVDLNRLLDDVGGRRAEEPVIIGKEELQAALAILHAWLNKSEFTYMLVSAAGGNLHVELAKSMENDLAPAMIRLGMHETLTPEIIDLVKKAFEGKEDPFG